MSDAHLRPLSASSIWGPCARGGAKASASKPRQMPLGASLGPTDGGRGQVPVGRCGWPERGG